MKKRVLSFMLLIVMVLTLLPCTALAASFNDVKTDAYYYDAVQWAVEQEITSGTSSTSFSPDSPCTRGQVVTFLWRANGKPSPKSSENPFKDVTADAYYYDAVLWAVEQEITSGTSSTTFSPDNPCTRGQVVTFLWRADGKPTPASYDSPFEDVKAGEYYYDAVLWAVEQEITSGTSSTTFSPGNTCTRGQVVTFLHRSMVKQEDPDDSGDTDSSGGTGSGGSDDADKPDEPDDTGSLGGRIVYITDTGAKYHVDGCRYLDESKHPIPINDAKAQGYEPCKVCNPGT